MNKLKLYTDHLSTSGKQSRTLKGESCLDLWQLQWNLYPSTMIGSQEDELIAVLEFWVGIPEIKRPRYLTCGINLLYS